MYLWSSMHTQCVHVHVYYECMHSLCPTLPSMSYIESVDSISRDDMDMPYT